MRGDRVVRYFNIFYSRIKFNHSVHAKPQLSCRDGCRLGRVRGSIPVASNRDFDLCRWVKPEFANHSLALHMDMNWLVAIKTVEIEPIRTRNSFNGGHNVSLRVVYHCI